MNDNKTLVVKILELLEEVKTYEQYKQGFLESLKVLFSRYQRKHLSYCQYQQELKQILQGKTKKELVNEYNAYIFSLLKRVEMYNSQIFYSLYNDHRFEQLILPKPVIKTVVTPVAKPIPRHLKKPTKPSAKTSIRKRLLPGKKHHVQAHAKVKKHALEVPPKPKIEAAPKTAFKAPEVKKLVAVKSIPFYIKLLELLGLRKKESALPTVHVEKVAIKMPTKAPELEVEKLDLDIGSRPSEKPIEAKVSMKIPAKPVKKAPDFEKGTSEVQLKKRSFIDWFLGKEETGLAKIQTVKHTADKEGAVGIGHAFGLAFFKRLFTKKKRSDYIGDKTSIGTSTLHVERKRKKAVPQMELDADLKKVTSTVLAEEAKRIQHIISSRKQLKVYSPSFFGAMANVFVKRITVILLNAFPHFFKKLYQQLRFANVKILSNTYVNMMVMGILISATLSFFLFVFIFWSIGAPLQQVLVRSAGLAFLAGVVSFAGFYSYPGSIAKSRRRSMNSNMPFAINHMAAVAASGVSPTQMFQLISQSTEYGEICVEFEKVVNYIEVFGYDVLTAIKSVAAITPSQEFRDFLEGMISTTSSGGDLKQYLSSKADETMMRYKLERKNYTETIATFSDVYTGILIAAPLFFVAALSLISMLGGKVGGFEVPVIIGVGTYAVIPFMNIAFLMFLSASQPDV